MKGVSTVIATILMLMITIGLAGLAASYFFGWFGGSTARAISLDETATSCSGTAISVYVRNIGTELMDLDDITVTTTAGSVVCGDGNDDSPLTPGGASLRCDNTATGVAGNNNVVISGPANTIRATVFCTG